MISPSIQVHGGKITGDERDPEAIVAYAWRPFGSISYTYTEPTIFFEYARTWPAWPGSNLRNVFVSNGFMTEASATAPRSSSTADNVDLKSMRDDSNEGLQGPVATGVDTISRLKERGSGWRSPP